MSSKKEEEPIIKPKKENNFSIHREETTIKSKETNEKVENKNNNQQTQPNYMYPMMYPQYPFMPGQEFNKGQPMPIVWVPMTYDPSKMTKDTKMPNMPQYPYPMFPYPFPYPQTVPETK